MNRVQLWWTQQSVSRNSTIAVFATNTLNSVVVCFGLVSPRLLNSSLGLYWLGLSDSTIGLMSLRFNNRVRALQSMIGNERLEKDERVIY